MGKTKILLVEDDPDILKINAIHLTRQGYDVITADTLERAYNAVVRENPGLIVLDVRMPDGSGVSFCEKIRGETAVPIIFLTCFDQDEDKVEGLMAGGDDYMTKPYTLTELTARIYALLRRAGMAGGEDMAGGAALDFPPVSIDTTAQRVYLDGEDVLLSTKEYQLLLFLARNAGKVFTAAELYEKVWALPPADGLITVRMHISSIRKKLNINGKSNVQIKTFRNAGYGFEYKENN